MHTATEIQTDMLQVSCGTQPIAPGSLLQLAAADRFGIVVDAPFGALGAGLLLSLAITSWFDTAGKRRRETNVYPQIYLFHVGGPWGCHSAFDFWPEGKEVFVPDCPVELLRAINRHGITHMAVPDHPARSVAHRWREPETAIDRLQQCWAYHPSGQTADADVTLHSTAPKLIWNYDGCLRPELYILDMEAAVAGDATYRADDPMATDFRRVIDHVRRRWHEVDRDSAAWQQAAARVAAAQAGPGLTETCRRLTPADALARLPGRLPQPQAAQA